MTLLASIPSPSSGVLDLGPLRVHMYGVVLLLGILTAVWLTVRRFEARGGDREVVYRAALWGVAWGIVGARLYHLATSWDEVPDAWWGPFAIWRGGLGVWGGISLGTVAGCVVARRARARARDLMDAVAPGALAAQGIGRIGNYWNQELFGRPTDLPWGLEIDEAHRPARYLDQPTFHPTFLYELLWDGLGVAVLLWVDARFRLRRPALFALYVAWYTFGRFFEELLRVDPSHHLAGLRLNAWVSLALFAGSAGFFLWWQLLREENPPPAAKEASLEGVRPSR